jgi:hypothetical protein
MDETLKYEVPTATQNIGDRYIEDFELMEAPELSSYADGSEYQSVDYLNEKGSIKYADLGGINDLIALQDDNFYGASGNRTTSRNRRKTSRNRKTARRDSARRSVGGFLGEIGEELKRGREARRQRRMTRVEGKSARKLEEAKAQSETARSIGKGAEAELEIAKTLAKQTPEVKKGLSTGAKIGIAVGILAVVGVVAYFIIKKRKSVSVVAPVTAGI